MLTSEQTDQLWPAFLKAQSTFTAASKGGKNPHLKNRYSTLADVMESCADALEANGFVLLQDTATTDRGVSVYTRIVHAASGQWAQGEVTLPPQTTAQGVGSAITYGRRYGLSALLALVSEDDDGNAASGRTAPPMAPALPPRPVPR